MQFLIADTFTASLAKLTAQEQKAAKTTAFDLQLNPAAPGHSFHRLDGAKDPNFWSVRVSADIRIIVHRVGAHLLLAYVDHHDAAYKWAARRRIERHPTTGAMQLVEIRERVEERVIHPAAPPAPSEVAKPRLFDKLRKPELMAFGVPEEWVDEVRSMTEDTIFDVIAHLPQEAQEALLKLAVGEQPEKPAPAPASADPFAHPDAQRRFRTMANAEELRLALDYPWEKWAVFLHPAQRDLVEREYSGPARVAGSAGTGKTIVALHRAVHLARKYPDSRVLLTTFSDALAHALKTKVRQLIGNEAAVADRIITQSISGFGLELYESTFGRPNIAAADVIRPLLEDAARSTDGARFSTRFLFSEWSDVVDSWQLHSWEAYRDVTRLGRKTRVGIKQREALWSIFEKVRTGLTARALVTWSDMFGRLTEKMSGSGALPFDFAIVDEAQDLGIAEARFLSAIAGRRTEGLFFSGDLGQRIFQQPFSWKSLGIDVRGRSYTLRINYRTSHQIRARTDRLLSSTISDVDGNVESRHGTVSAFDGPQPEILVLGSIDEETARVGRWIVDRLKDGVLPHEIGVFVRTMDQIDRVKKALAVAGVRHTELSEKSEATVGLVAIGAMHLAKGLEFRAVAVMACDDEVLPLRSRIEEIADEADLEEAYVTERHLLYVACTRAREFLLVTGVDPGSEFLNDFDSIE